MTDPIMVVRYASEIVELIDNQEDFTRGDLQGAAEAIVMQIIEEAKRTA